MERTLTSSTGRKPSTATTTCSQRSKFFHASLCKDQMLLLMRSRNQMVDLILMKKLLTKPKMIDGTQIPFAWTRIMNIYKAVSRRLSNQGEFKLISSNAIKKMRYSEKSNAQTMRRCVTLWTIICSSLWKRTPSSLILMGKRSCRLQKRQVLCIIQLLSKSSDHKKLKMISALISGTNIILSTCRGIRLSSRWTCSAWGNSRRLTSALAPFRSSYTVNTHTVMTLSSTPETSSSPSLSRSMTRAGSMSAISTALWTSSTTWVEPGSASQGFAFSLLLCSILICFIESWCISSTGDPKYTNMHTQRACKSRSPKANYLKKNARTCRLKKIRNRRTRGVRTS